MPERITIRDKNNKWIIKFNIAMILVLICCIAVAIVSKRYSLALFNTVTILISIANIKVISRSMG